MGLSQNMNFSDTEDEEQAPIEMTSMTNRKSKNQLSENARKKPRREARSPSEDQEEGLQLFDQNSPAEKTSDPQP